MYKLKTTYFVVNCPEKGYFIAAKKKQACKESPSTDSKMFNASEDEPSQA